MENNQENESVETLNKKLNALMDDLKNPSKLFRWRSTDTYKPTKSGYYYILREGSSPLDIVGTYPAVHYWYNEEQEWSSKTAFWLEEVEELVQPNQ